MSRSIDRERSLVERFGIGVTALVIVQKRQIVQRQRDIGMVGPKRFLMDGERSLVKRFGVGIAALVFLQQGQIVQPHGKMAMLGPSDFSRL